MVRREDKYGVDPFGPKMGKSIRPRPGKQWSDLPEEMDFSKPIKWKDQKIVPPVNESAPPVKVNRKRKRKMEVPNERIGRPAPESRRPAGKKNQFKMEEPGEKRKRSSPDDNQKKKKKKEEKGKKKKKKEEKGKKKKKKEKKEKLIEYTKVNGDKVKATQKQIDAWTKRRTGRKNQVGPKIDYEIKTGKRKGLTVKKTQKQIDALGSSRRGKGTGGKKALGYEDADDQAYELYSSSSTKGGGRIPWTTLYGNAYRSLSAEDKNEFRKDKRKKFLRRWRKS